MGDSIEVKVIKSGFSAVNENLTDVAMSLRKLTDIAKSFQKMAEKEEERWRTVDVDGYPDSKYGWVLAIVSCNGEIDDIPIVVKYKLKESCWVVHFTGGYADIPLNSDCEVVKWLPIFGECCTILYGNEGEIERVYCYGE